MNYNIIPIVKIGKNQAITTSIIIAEVFEKQHKDVLKAIKNIECSEEFNRRNFALIFYKDTYSRDQRAYEITRDGFMLLAMGFTGKKAMQWKENYINAFNQMEKQIVDQNIHIVSNLKQEIIPAITKAVVDLMSIGLVKSELTKSQVEKADNTVNALSYDRISHDEKKCIIEIIRSKCEKDRGKYFLLKNNLFNHYGVTTYFLDI